MSAGASTSLAALIPNAASTTHPFSPALPHIAFDSNNYFEVFCSDCGRDARGEPFHDFFSVLQRLIDHIGAICGTIC